MIPAHKSLRRKNSDLEPRYTILFHFLHFYFDPRVQFVFEFQRLHVIYVSGVVKPILFRIESQVFLQVFQQRVGRWLDVTIAIVFVVIARPPRAHTKPTKIISAIGTLQTIATAMLFYANTAFGTFLCVHAQPVRRLRIVATFSLPFT